MYIENSARGIRLNVLVPVGLIFLVLLNGWRVISVMLLAAAVHECGHIATALLCGAAVDRMDVELWGGRMYYTGVRSYQKEFIISLGGIAANLLLAPLGLIPIFGIWGRLFFWACICYAAVNLLPAKTLDGGEALRCIMSINCDDAAAYTALNAVNTMAVLLMCVLGLIVSALTGFNTSVLMLCVITVVLAAER